VRSSFKTARLDPFFERVYFFLPSALLLFELLVVAKLNCAPGRALELCARQTSSSSLSFFSFPLQVDSFFRIAPVPLSDVLFFGQTEREHSPSLNACPCFLSLRLFLNGSSSISQGPLSPPFCSKGRISCSSPFPRPSP